MTKKELLRKLEEIKKEDLQYAIDEIKDRIED